MWVYPNGLFTIQYRSPADQTIHGWSFYDDPWGRKDSLLPTTMGKSFSATGRPACSIPFQPLFILEKLVHGQYKNWGNSPKS